MHKLIIHRQYFTEADCYNQATIQKQVGVQVHCTVSGNPYLKRYVQPDDGELGKNKYGNSHNRPNIKVCASAYIGKLENGEVAVYQTLPWDYRCWLSGSGSKGNANRVGYIGFEVCCLLSDKDYFYDAVMDKAVKLTAYLCKELGVYPDGTTVCGKSVMDHSELHRAGYASNHADITNWLKVYGKTMNDFRNEVKKVLEEGIEVEYVENKARPTLKRGSKGANVEVLQRDLKYLGYDINIDGKFGAATAKIVSEFQTKHGLVADGIVGPMTWDALDKAVEDLAVLDDTGTDEDDDDYIEVEIPEDYILVEEVKLDEAIKRLEDLLEEFKAMKG